jgi:hypothetical protein
MSSSSASLHRRPDTINTQTSIMNFPPFSVENTGSCMLTPEQITQIWRWLPARLQIHELKVIYSNNIHGCRLMTLFDKIEFHPATLILILTRRDAIFGAFCSQPWSHRNERKVGSKFIGTGETFLFELVPNVCVYKWVGLGCKGQTSLCEELFMYADHTKLIVGGSGSGGGPGLCINSDVISGHSDVSDTFKNDILGGESQFEIISLEVLSFDSG